MKIAIFGLGYVGLTSAGCLLKQGYDVIGFDTSVYKVESINDGACPIFEPELDVLLKDGYESGKFTAHVSVTGMLNDVDVAIVCVGTPSASNGAHDMSYIAEVSRQIAFEATKREQSLEVVYRSTFRPGTMEGLIKPIYDGVKSKVTLVYNPEFLRESTAVKDYFSPPKIVIGLESPGINSKLEALYSAIEAPVFRLGYKESELIKFIDNSFHALKVAFANEMGRLCEANGINAMDVHKVFIADTKLNISPYYLRPGGAFGGSCLPKDVRAIMHYAHSSAIEIPVLSNVIRSNESHKEFIFDKTAADLVAGDEVIVVGLAFKANTNDLRESPNVDLVERLIGKGISVRIFDPSVDLRFMVGRNFAFTMSHLPHIESLLIGPDEMLNKTFKKAIFATGVELPAYINYQSSVKIY